jgi:hypothetical protein
MGGHACGGFAFDGVQHRGRGSLVFRKIFDESRDQDGGVEKDSRRPYFLDQV